ncbi:MAG: hybrid sensor histidine kinase/response regulator [Elusimicrobiota bacterium]
MKPRILLVTSDKALYEAFEKSCAERDAEVRRVSSAKATRRAWDDGESRVAGVVADVLSLRGKERRHLLELHRRKDAPPLVLLDPPRSSPLSGKDLVASLHWPLEESVLEALGGLAPAPIVLLSDPTLYVTGTLHARLDTCGLRTSSAESTAGLAGILNAPPEDPSQAGAARAVIVRWAGDLFEAEGLAERVRQSAPAARFFLVESQGPIHAAEVALRRNRPALLPRRFFEVSVDLLLGKPIVDPMALGRVLLVDPVRPALVQLSRDLMDEGYEVAACLSTEEAVERASADYFHIAVVSAALTSGRAAGVELAQKLRERDPDMRIILLVDRYPLKEALRGVSLGVEVGLDDCLLKPVEASRLKFSITRALERRHLLLENKRLLSELKTTNRELEQLTGFQSKFFAMVAHDVKNPLSAILGYAQLLTMKTKEPTPLTYAGHIESSAKTLNALVSDLVDFAAIESGKLRVEIGELDLARVVCEVRSRVQVAADRRRIRLRVTVPEGLPKLSGDPLRIGQVIQNLATNAIQYTPEGGAVSIEVQRGPALITLSVRDTGIGIAKSDLPRIFNRFFQAENAQTMRRGGFGLGLKIAQEIVKAHGGGMGVDSELGKGSAFYFAIPIPR